MQRVGRITPPSTSERESKTPKSGLGGPDRPEKGGVTERAVGTSSGKRNVRVERKFVGVVWWVSEKRTKRRGGEIQRTLFFFNKVQKL